MNRLGLLRKLVEGKELTLEEAKSLGDVSSFVDLRLPFKYATEGTEKSKIGQGGYGEVFKIKNGTEMVVKFPKYAIGNFLENGYDIQKKAFEKKLNCPKPEGLFNVYNNKNRKWEKGFVMEYIKEDDGDNYPFLFKKEKSRFVKKGFKPYKDSDYLSNSLFNNGKVYLIDFDLWHYHEPKENFCKNLIKQIFKKGGKN